MRRVAEFLTGCGLQRSRLHSYGYSAVYGDTVWLGQYPSSKSWRDAGFPRDNNHGRVFPAWLLRDDSGATAYITVGAFSRESGILHRFLGFNSARDALCVQPPWRELERTHIGNEFPLTNAGSAEANASGHGLPYSTGDHDGLRMFYLRPAGR
jgi:hypothetical protein